MSRIAAVSRSRAATPIKLYQEEEKGRLRSLSVGSAVSVQGLGFETRLASRPATLQLAWSVVIFLPSFYHNFPDGLTDM